MLRAIKVRLYPTKDQATKMFQHIGASRYIWNWAIDIQKANHEQGNSHIKSFDVIRMLTPLKHDGLHDWLNDVSNATLQHACIDLEHAYVKFFRKVAGYPHYKSKKQSSQQFALDSYRSFFKSDKYFQVPVIGLVKYKTDYTVPLGKYVFKDPRILYIGNKWFLSIVMDVERQNVRLSDEIMGIDLGVKTTATVVCGNKYMKFPNINKSKRIRYLLTKEKYLQKQLSKKYQKNKVGCIYHKTNNIVKLENKIKRIRRTVTNIRNNYNHQLTAQLVGHLPKRVVMEDLNVLGMMKNRCLAKAVQSQNFSKILHMMRYKCENYGIEFVQADRFYPSSRICRNCGAVNKKLTLANRIFICPDCGYKIDRDFNAALNLAEYKA